eukprot:17309-Amphidinium_carterae.1
MELYGTRMAGNILHVKDLLRMRIRIDYLDREMPLKQTTVDKGARATSCCIAFDGIYSPNIIITYVNFWLQN